MLQYSIIICSFNRAALLKETIDSVLNKLTDYSKYELLIIDNNSTDNTAEVVSQYQSNPVVRYVLETNQGVSHARNRGIQEAQYPIIAFIDDDIDIDPYYLDIMDLLYTDPSIYIAGGKVVPYQMEVPDWLPKKRHYLASLFDLGDAPLLTTKLLGTNHSFRKEVVAQIGGYNTDVGLTGNLKIGGDENEFLLRAYRKGYKILYHPELIIYHKISNRLTQDFLLNYSYNVGITEARIDARHNKFLMAVKFSKYLVDLVLGFLRLKRGTPFENRLVKAHLIGYIKCVLRSNTAGKLVDAAATQLSYKISII